MPLVTVTAKIAVRINAEATSMNETAAKGMSQRNKCISSKSIRSLWSLHRSPAETQSSEVTNATEVEKT